MPSQNELTLNPVAENEPTPSARQIVRTLLSEAFAVEKKLAELTLDVAGRIIEEAEETLPHADAANPLRQSFERCKALYVELLMEVEAAGPAANEAMLGRWLAAEKKPPTVPPAAPGANSPGAPTATPATAPTVASAPPLPAGRPGDDRELTFASSIAQEYFALFRWFENPTATPPSKNQLVRLQAQNLCFAGEIEIQDRLRPELSRIWQDRESLFVPLLDKRGSGYELHGNVRTKLNALAERHSQFLPDGKFPFVPFVNAMRYCLTLTDAENFRASMLEAGMFFLLFGLPRQSAIGTQMLDIRGLNEEQITELAFRLLRLQKLRNRTFALPTPVDRPTFESIWIDLKKTLYLLNKAKFGKSG